jgi:hypothetical protein
MLNDSWSGFSEMEIRQWGLTDRIQRKEFVRERLASIAARQSAAQTKSIQTESSLPCDLDNDDQYYYYFDLCFGPER